VASEPNLVQAPQPIECIGCGCTDDHACLGGCAWVAVDAEECIGLCSNCAVKPLDQLILGGLFP
jgi:hypothetical protein